MGSGASAWARRYRRPCDSQDATVVAELALPDHEVLGAALGIHAALGLPGDPEVLQVRVGLARGHRSPAFGTEEQMAIPLHGHPAVRRRPGGETGQALSMVIDDVATTSGEIGERMAVRGKYVAHATQPGDHLQGNEEASERVAAGTDARDVRSDRGKDVIAGKEGAALRIVQAQVVERVSGRVNGEPVRSPRRIGCACFRRIDGSASGNTLPKTDDVAALLVIRYMAPRRIDGA